MRKDSIYYLGEADQEEIEKALFWEGVMWYVFGFFMVATIIAQVVMWLI